VRLLLAIAMMLPAVSTAGAACMKPNQLERAEGRLTVGNFKDAADRPETAFILRLSAAACLDAEDGMDAVNSTRTIHVYSANGAIQASMRRLVGGVVDVRGKPFSAHTAHHHAPIVMEVSEIRSR
jgi:uncharacterized protein DUF4431